MNIRRIWVIAANVFREVIRDRVLYLLGLFALVLVLVSRLLPEISSIAADKILVDLGLGAIALFGLIITLFVGTGLVSKEVEKRTVFVLLSKPVSRAELIVGKHLGLTAVLAVLIAAMGGIYVLLLHLYGIPFDGETLAIVGLFLLLELSLLTAFALLFGVSTGPLLATLLTLAIYVMGHLSPDVVKLAQLTDSASLQQTVRSLYLLLPDLSQFNLRNDGVYNLLPTADTLLQTALYGMAYSILVLLLTSIIFSRKEF